MTYSALQDFGMALCVGRVFVGLAPFVAAGTTSRLLGFPPEQDSPSARLFARMFGVRDAALGVLVWHALPDPAQLKWTFLFNAAMDFGDGISCLIPLVRRQGIDRAAAGSLAFAVLGCSLFLTAWALSNGV